MRQALAKILLFNLTKYFNQDEDHSQNKTFLLASALDPSNWALESFKKYNNAMTDILKQEGAKFVPTLSNEDAKPPPKKKKGRNSLSRSQSDASKKPVNRLENEIKKLSSSERDVDEVSLLEWWQMRSKDFPILRNVAQQYLSILSSSAPSERFFSRLGYLLSPRRTQMNKSNVERIMFISENLKFKPTLFNLSASFEEENEESDLN